jgi:hypothetical protein
MFPQQQQQSPTNLSQLPDMMANVVYNFCSIFTAPLEMVLRPQYGSRYFSPIITCFTAGLMIFLPLISGMASGFPLPFMMPHPVGLFGIATLSKLYFLGVPVHGFRTWLRMIHMEREENSYYEGPPLFIFRLLPFSFWTTRILIEPLFVIALTLVLTNFFILQSPAEHFLLFAALMLAMKQYVAWYKWWQVIRGLMDMRNMGPKIARISDNTASDQDLESAHLASFPKNLPEDVRRSAARYIARTFAPDSETKQQ